MPTGLWAQNANGFVQIDEGYRNYHLVKSVSGLAVPGGIPSLGTNFSPSAIFALIPRSGSSGSLGVCPTPGDYASGQRRFWYYYRTGDTSVALDVYVFDLVDPKGGSGAGLEVYRPDGTLAFSSADYPMKVVGTFAAGSDATNASAGPWYAAIPPSREYALAATTAGIREDDDGFGGQWEKWTTYAVRLNGTNNFKFFTNYDDTSGSGGSGGNYNPNNAVLSGLMIDVTNLPTNYTR